MRNLVFILLSILFLASSCQNNREIFLGLELGMSEESFYEALDSLEIAGVLENELYTFDLEEVQQLKEIQGKIHYLFTNGQLTSFWIVFQRDRENYPYYEWEHDCLEPIYVNALRALYIQKYGSPDEYTDINNSPSWKRGDVTIFFNNGDKMKEKCDTTQTVFQPSVSYWLNYKEVLKLEKKEQESKEEMEKEKERKILNDI